MCFFCDVLLLFSALLSLHEHALEPHTTCHQKLLKIGHTTTKGWLQFSIYSVRSVSFGALCCDWFRECSSWVMSFCKIDVSLLFIHFTLFSAVILKLVEHVLLFAVTCGPWAVCYMNWWRSSMRYSWLCCSHYLPLFFTFILLKTAWRYITLRCGLLCYKSI